MEPWSPRNSPLHRVKRQIWPVRALWPINPASDVVNSRKNRPDNDTYDDNDSDKEIDNILSTLTKRPEPGTDEGLPPGFEIRRIAKMN